MYSVQSSKSFLVGHRHVEVIGSSKERNEKNKISDNISDRTYSKVRFGWLEDRTSVNTCCQGLNACSECFEFAFQYFTLNTRQKFLLPIGSIHFLVHHQFAMLPPPISLKFFFLYFLFYFQVLSVIVIKIITFAGLVHHIASE